jgi:hypothetical protein
MIDKLIVNGAVSDLDRSITDVTYLPAGQSLIADAHWKNMVATIAPELTSKDAKEKALTDALAVVPVSKTITGDTSDEYQVVLSFKCLGYSKKTLFLSCTHEKANLAYRVRGYANVESKTFIEIWPETVLAHGDMQPFVIDTYYALIAVEIKSANEGEPSSYSLDYCGGP